MINHPRSPQHHASRLSNVVPLQASRRRIPLSAQLATLVRRAIPSEVAPPLHPRCCIRDLNALDV
jgi:hypothetical protein